MEGLGRSLGEALGKPWEGPLGSLGEALGRLLWGTCREVVGSIGKAADRAKRMRHRVEELDEDGNPLPPPPADVAEEAKEKEEKKKE